MKPTSLRRLVDRADVDRRRRAWPRESRAIPSGAARIERYLSRATPQALRISQAWTAEPPVASIGSTTRARPTRALRRDPGVILLGLERVLVATEADVPDLGLGDDVEDAVGHPQAGPEDRDDGDRVGEDLAGRRARGVWTSTASSQVGRRLGGQEHRRDPDQAAELGRAGRDVAEGRQLAQDQRMGRRVDGRQGRASRVDGRSWAFADLRSEEPGKSRPERNSSYPRCYTTGVCRGQTLPLFREPGPSRGRTNGIRPHLEGRACPAVI